MYHIFLYGVLNSYFLSGDFIFKTGLENDGTELSQSITGHWASLIATSQNLTFNLSSRQLIW